MDELDKIHLKKVNIENVADALYKAPFNSLVPILIRLFREKALKISIQDLLSSYIEKYELYGKSSFSQREVTQFMQFFFDSIPKNFDTIEFSPIAPLGSCVSLTKLSQDTRMSAIKKSEVVSDSTIMLALEAAKRRKISNIESDIELATCHRLLRLQNFEESKDWSQHFRILGTISAGRRTGKNNFLLETIEKHIRNWLSFFEKLNANGFVFKNIHFTFSHIGLIDLIIERFSIPREEIYKSSLIEGNDYFDSYKIPLPKNAKNFSDFSFFFTDGDKKSILYKQLSSLDKMINILRKDFPHNNFEYELNRKIGLGYFQSFCFHGYADSENRKNIALIDGGVVDWLQKLLSDKREMAITSSFGAEVGMAVTRRVKADVN